MVAEKEECIYTPQHFNLYATLTGQTYIYHHNIVKSLLNANWYLNLGCLGPFSTLSTLESVTTVKIPGVRMRSNSGKLRLTLRAHNSDL